jgi:hypothetical protein
LQAAKPLANTKFRQISLPPFQGKGRGPSSNNLLIRRCAWD